MMLVVVGTAVRAVTSVMLVGVAVVVLVEVVGQNGVDVFSRAAVVVLLVQAVTVTSYWRFPVVGAATTTNKRERARWRAQHQLSGSTVKILMVWNRAAAASEGVGLVEHLVNTTAVPMSQQVRPVETTRL